MLDALTLFWLLVQVLACVALCVLFFFALGSASDWLGRQTGRPFSHGICVALALSLAFWLVFLR